SVSVYQNGAVVKGCVTDIDGKYEITGLAAGTYDIEASYVGYKKEKIPGIVIKEGVYTTADITMEQEGKMLETVVMTKSANTTSHRKKGRYKSASKSYCPAYGSG